MSQGPSCPTTHSRIPNALDILMNTGTKLYPMYFGYIYWQGWGYAGTDNTSTGNMIYINYPEYGMQSRYAHLDSFAVTTGEFVGPATVVGYSGGTSSNPEFRTPHLHLELRLCQDTSPCVLADITPHPGIGGLTCSGDVRGGLIELGHPRVRINFPTWDHSQRPDANIYYKENHFVDGSKIHISADATDAESGIHHVEIVGFYATQNDGTPSWHLITSQMNKIGTNTYEYYWDISQLPDQVDFNNIRHEIIRLEVKAYDYAGNLTQAQVPIGILRRVGRGTAYQDKYIDAYQRANTFIKPGATIINRYGHMEPYWWPSDTSSYRIVRQDFQHGSIVHDQCGLRKNGERFECSSQDNPAERAYFVPAEIMALYEDMVAHPANYDDDYQIGVPISDAFEAAPDPETGENGIGMSFGQDTGRWIPGTRQYSDKNLWQGDIYYSRTTGVANEIHGGIFRKYHELGGTGSELGFPRSNELEADPSPQGVHGRLNRFAHGEIYWREDERASHFITEEFLAAYMPGTGGSMGFPKTDVHGEKGSVRYIEFDDGCLKYDGGTIYDCSTTCLSGTFHSGRRS